MKKRSNILCKRLKANPSNRNIRNQLFIVVKQHKILTRQLKRLSKQDIIRKLDTLSDVNPTEYWKLLNNLRENDKSKSANDSPIAASDFIDHFKNLLGSKPSETVSDQALLSELELLETLNDTSTLDYPITER